jgi:hypothetical protein
VLNQDRSETAMPWNLFKKQPAPAPVAPASAQPAREVVCAYAKINMRIGPLQRGELFEDPLADALAPTGLARMIGAGTQSADGEIQFCGIDLELDPARVIEAVTFIAKFLTAHGAPRGSQVIFETPQGKSYAECGLAEGLGVYLPRPAAENEYAMGQVVELITKLVEPPEAGRGYRMGMYQSPTEIMLYFYGRSFQKMVAAISPLINSNPLCKGTRLVEIA